MLSPSRFFDSLTELGVDFFTGVPDSLLKTICAYISDHTDESQHVIAANEGAAVGLALGHHIASGKTPMVYMQNSGIGNAVNPLLSLADKEVYSIPMLLMIGWRGEPGVKDEPQHVKQGRVTTEMLDVMEVPYFVIGDEDEETSLKKLAQAYTLAKEKSCACALVVKKGAFAEYKAQEKVTSSHPLTREDAVKVITDNLHGDDIVVATTGMTSRELFEYREELQQGHEKDFLTVGGMGHASQIAMGVAMAKPNRLIYCLDGDGASLMHLGSLAILGQSGCENYKHIVINNGAHDSVGGQPTIGFDIDFKSIALGCGYKKAVQCATGEELAAALDSLRSEPGPCLVEVLVKKGNRKDLGRPTTTPLQNKEAFISFVQGS